MLTDEVVRQLRESVRTKLDFNGAASDDRLMQMVEEAVFAWCERNPLTAADKVKLVKRLFHSFRGLDILQPLMEDASITEIMINHHAEIFVERQGRLSKLPFTFESSERLEDLIQTIVAGVNRVVNESSPIVDARLKDGSRVHVVLPPVALKGPCMTIRKFPAKPLTMEDLVVLGALTTEAAAFLQDIIAAQYNVFVSGGTGTGKTTFLNALSQFIPSDERVITIEDSAELQIRTVPNLVTLETRNANTEGKGEITIRELIRASLRMRPNRIIVGEVRGGESLDMLQALNTGHSGMSTGHSNGPKDMLSRLETMVLSAADLPILVIRQQIASALQVIVQLSRMRDRTRRVTEITEITGLVNGEIQLNPLFHFVEKGDSEDTVIGDLCRTDRSLVRVDKLAMAGKSRKGEFRREYTDSQQAHIAQ